MLALLLLFAGTAFLLDTQPPAFSTLRICSVQQPAERVTSGK